jgi:hypothetical protein
MSRLIKRRLLLIFLLSIGALWLPGFSSTRHPEPAHPEVSEVGDLWLYRGPWHNVCRRPGLACHASASLCWGNNPEDGGDHGESSRYCGSITDF